MNFGQNLYQWFLSNAQSLVLMSIVVIGIYLGFKREFATTTDIPACLELAYLVIDGFPNLNENEYLTELERGILEQRVLILTDKLIKALISNLL